MGMTARNGSGDQDIRSHGRVVAGGGEGDHAGRAAGAVQAHRDGARVLSRKKPKWQAVLKEVLFKQGDTVEHCEGEEAERKA
jgi:hypothetical protein